MNSKTRKNTLVLSVLALLLCIAMLIATTFAWFTDSVSNTGNKIKAGTLDISLWAKDVTAEGYTNLSNSEAPIFNYDKWEPGYTVAKHIKVQNDGNLALKYTLHIVAKETVSKLAEVIDVYYAPSEIALSERADLDQLTKIGTLKDVLAAADATVIKDQMLPNEKDFATLALHMQEEAGNGYQGLDIGSTFDLNLVATQLNSESDSFGPDYDKNASFPVTDQNRFETAISEAKAGDVVGLSSGSYTLPATSIASGVVLSGNGDSTVLTTNQNNIINDNVTISNMKIMGTGASGTTGELNISGNSTKLSNITFVGEGPGVSGNRKLGVVVSTNENNPGTIIENVNISNVFRGIQFWSLSGNSVIRNSVINVPGYTFNIDDVKPNSTLTVENTTLKGWTSYTNGIKLVTFDNCQFGENTYASCKPYSDTVFNGCQFDEGFKVNAGGDSEYTMTFNQCFIGGVAITKDNIQTKLFETSGWNANAKVVVNGVEVTM